MSAQQKFDEMNDDKTNNTLIQGNASVTAVTQATVDGKGNKASLEDKSGQDKTDSDIHSENNELSLEEEWPITIKQSVIRKRPKRIKPSGAAAVPQEAPKVEQDPEPSGFSLAISEYVSVNREGNSAASVSFRAMKCLHKRRLEERGFRLTNKKLGQGGFGAVYKVYANNNDSTPLACKIMILSKETRSKKDRNSMLQAFSNEVFVMKSCPHTNIVSIHKNFIYSHGTSTDNILMVHSYIVMEYATNGTLYCKMKKQSCPFTETESLYYFRQLSNALVHLHKRGIAHRDLKLGNILLTKSASNEELVKLTDFGLSRLVNSQVTGLTRFSKPAGTLSYMSPELICCYVQYYTGEKKHIRPYDCFPTDIWALGMCLYLMLCKIHPFGSPPREKTERIEYAKQTLAKQHKREWSIPSAVEQSASSSCLDLMRQLMEPKHRKRLNIYQVIAHQWLAASATDPL